MQALRGGAGTAPTHSLGGQQHALAAVPIVLEGAEVGLRASLDSRENLAPHQDWALSPSIIIHDSTFGFK